MALNAAATEPMLDDLASRATHASIHSADPGANGDNEFNTRQSITWNPASGTNLDNDGSIVFEVEEGDTIHSVGLWTAATGGTFLGSRPLSTPAEYSNPGTFTVDDLDVNIPAQV